MKRFVILFALLVLLALPSLAAQPCDNEVHCEQAGDAYCEQIEGSTLEESEIYTVVGIRRCNICCANGHCVDLICFGPGVTANSSDEACIIDETDWSEFESSESTDGS